MLVLVLYVAPPGAVHNNVPLKAIDGKDNVKLASSSIVIVSFALKAE